jgi:membrane peptidoglycan carboxypeptidase
MAFAPRQPGSSTKPFVYLSTFEMPGKPRNEAWTPGTLVADIQHAFPDGANPPYVPTNYDGKEHGMVTMRTALANSYNIPAVRALEAATLPNYLELMSRLGVTTLTRPDFGLSLSLGAGEIPLIELTDAYATVANQGVRVPPVTISKITDSQGQAICEQGTDKPCQDAKGQQVVSAVDAFLLTDVLSDNEARIPAFGPNSALTLGGRPVAAKTGTTNDYRDNLTLGFTPQLVTGVWVGNSNNTPMQNVSGVSGAGPIWNQFMNVALANEPRLLLMDEPTAGMAPRERHALMTLTRRLVKEMGIAVLFTEHSMDVVFAHADRLIVLARGKLIAAGTPEEIRGDPRVAEVYFGSGKLAHGAGAA